MSCMEEKIIPLFKSNYSIGSSILTLNNPDSDHYPNGPKSIFSILNENNLNELYLLENNFNSFYKSLKYCESNNINLRYGVNFFYSENSVDFSKFSIFIKNDKGYSDLIKLNSIFNIKKFLSKEDLDSLFTSNLLMGIPHYDSFIFKNSFSFSKFSDFLLKFDPVFFCEENDLPFDSVIKDSILNLTNGKFEVQNSKTILYFQRRDLESFLTYKCICNRDYKQRSLSQPNFSHFSSAEFCWESFLEKTNDK